MRPDSDPTPAGRLARGSALSFKDRGFASVWGVHGE